MRGQLFTRVNLDKKLSVENPMTHLDSFSSQAELIKQFGKGNAHLVWGLSLYLDYPSPAELGAESLTDGGNDKKIDFLRYEPDTKRAICAQGYFSERKVDAAPANKASDLNTATAWLLNGDIDRVPDFLRIRIEEIRQAIDSKELEQIDLLYVHNLPESIGVTTEILTAKANLERLLGDYPVTIVAKEIGFQELERIYNASSTHIKITDSIDCPSRAQFSTEGPNWKAHVLSVPGAWLRDLYLQHGDALYSANYRGFLGAGKRKKINTGIRSTAETQPHDFWVFNNGITILTRSVVEEKSAGLKLSGLSIINGAQTSGSLGSVDDKKASLEHVSVLCRIIECSDPETISSIVRFNNTQNEITTWDRYSNDPDQARIAKEFETLGYQYSVKRGSEASGADLSIESVAAPLLAFGGGYADANIGKNYIFDTRAVYKTAFDNKKARHILLAYSCSVAIDEIRSGLRNKLSNGNIIDVERKQLELFQSLRFKNFLLAVVGGVMQELIGRQIKRTEVSFSPQVAKRQSNSIVALSAMWIPVMRVILTTVSLTMRGKSLPDYLRQDDAFKQMVDAVSSQLYISRIQSSQLFDDFARNISDS